MYFFTWAPTATAKFQINIFLYACYKTKRPGFGYNTAPIVRRWPELETRRQSGGRQDCEKKKNTPKNREGGGRVVSWERRAASAMLSAIERLEEHGLWFLPFQIFFFFLSLSKSTWKLFWGIAQVGVYGEANRGPEMGRAGWSSSHFYYPKAQKWRTQRSKGPAAPSSSQASLRSLQPGGGGNWRREAGHPGWKLTKKSLPEKYPCLEKGDKQVPWHFVLLIFFTEKAKHSTLVIPSSFTPLIRTFRICSHLFPLSQNNSNYIFCLYTKMALSPIC